LNLSLIEPKMGKMTDSRAILLTISLISSADLYIRCDRIK